MKIKFWVIFPSFSNLNVYTNWSPAEIRPSPSLSILTYVLVRSKDESAAINTSVVSETVFESESSPSSLMSLT